MKVTAFRNVAFVADVQGRAHDDGVELFVRRDFTERLGGFISYTVSRADRDVPGHDALSTFDRPQVLSVVLGYISVWDTARVADGCSSRDAPMTWLVPPPTAAGSSAGRRPLPML